MTETIIRPLTAADIAACAQLMAASPLWIRYGITVERAAARFESGLSEGATILVAESGGAITGFVWCVARGAFARSGYIPLIGVAPDEAGQGIGAALLARAESYFSETGTHVFLLVSDFNTAAQRFYQRRGYTQCGALPDYVLPGITELIYWKHLT